MQRFGVAQAPRALDFQAVGPVTEIRRLMPASLQEVSEAVLRNVEA